MFNARLGYTRREDTLPKRFLEEGASVVKIEGERLTDEVLEDGLIVDFEEVLDIYYELKGWDRDGIPTKEKLEELDLFLLIDKISVHRV